MKMDVQNTFVNIVVLTTYKSFTSINMQEDFEENSAFNESPQVILFLLFF